MTARTDSVLSHFFLSAPAELDVRTDAAADLLEELLTNLFDSCCAVAKEKMDAQGFTPGHASLRLYVVYASEEWADAAKSINQAKIKLNPAPDGQPYLVLDDRGYIGALLQIPKEEQGPLEPVLTEFMEEEAKLHPEYIRPEPANKQPEIKLTTAQFEDIVSVDRLADKQLLAAYFDTYAMLEVYRGLHDYDDPKAKELAVRMELIVQRMAEVASGSV